MKIRDNKGSITVFVLVGLLFMTGFLIISFGSNINKSKSAKEQFNIISSIYSYKDGDANAYDRAYTAIRKRNAQILTETSENSSTLELTKTFTDTLSNYKIYGNSVQNGTPSPDNPVEIQSVGDKTKNLFSIEKFKTLVNTEINNQEKVQFTAFDNKECVRLTGATYHIHIVDFDPTKTYTISYRGYYVKEDGLNYSGGGFGIKMSDESLQYAITSSAYPNQWHTITKTITGASYLYLTYNYNYLTYLDLNSIQVEEGSTATDYEPYGYKIPVKVSGKNLWDFNNSFKDETREHYGITYTKTEDGILANGTATNQSYIAPYEMVNELVVGKSYVLSTNYADAVPTIQYIENGTTYYKKSFTMNENITSVKIYFYFRANTSVNNVNIKMQLEEGTKATDYESYVEPQIVNIYLDEPLRKVVDYADYIDFANGNVVRKIYSEKFNLSNATIYKTGDNWQRENCTSVYAANKLAYVGDGANISNGQISNIFKSGAWEWNGRNEPFNYILTGNRNTNLYLIIENKYLTGITDESSDTEKINAVKQYFSNYNLEVAYVLKEEIPETIELPELKTFEDYTNIEVLTEIAPSKIEATYYGYTME